jgi:general secretion pathway protein D
MMLLLCGLWLAACSSNALENTGSIDTGPRFAKKRTGTVVTERVFGTAQERPAFRGGTYLGSGKLLDPDAQLDRAFDASPGDDEGMTLNVLNASIPDAAKAVLGDLMGLSYAIDPRVQGMITVQTGRPVSKSAALELFEAALQSNGAAIVGDAGGMFRIVPQQEAAGFRGRHAVSRTKLDNSGPGISTQIIPLQFIAASDIERLVKPIASQNVVFTADETRNALIVTGAKQDIANILEAVAIFDVDWMQGMSFALYPVQSPDPGQMTRELDIIFSNDKSGPAKGIVRFVPNRRLKSILVISSKPHYVIQAGDWIKRLDAAAAGAEQQLYVYNIQNRPAQELARLLSKVFAAETGKQIETTAKPKAPGDVAPKFQPAEITDGSAVAGTKQDFEGAGEEPIPAADEEAGFDEGMKDAAIRVVADEANDALLILCTGLEYERIKKMLVSIDVTPKQVLLEATIAEVALNDQLRFGLKWFFNDGNSSTGFTNMQNGAVGSVFPGFNYVFASSNIRVALEALSGITNVNVISSPTLMVLDNRTAILQVGDQVPIAVQQATGVNTNDAPIVNAIELKDTGVILQVTPRINDNGRVLLEIQQEVSDVVPTTSSGIDSPTIQQRKIKTSVVVDDGQTLALGGLIQDQDRTNKTQVPVLGDIPLLGNLFKVKTNTKIRTELLILITPRVVRDAQEAREITEEFRNGLNVVVRKTRPQRKTLGSELKRMLQ